MVITISAILELQLGSQPRDHASKLASDPVTIYGIVTPVAALSTGVTTPSLLVVGGPTTGGMC